MGISVWTERYGAISPLEIKVRATRMASRSTDARRLSIMTDLLSKLRESLNGSTPYNSTPLWVTMQRLRVPKLSSSQDAFRHTFHDPRPMRRLFFLSFFLSSSLSFPLSLSLTFHRRFRNTANRERSVQ